MATNKYFAESESWLKGVADGRKGLKLPPPRLIKLGVVSEGYLSGYKAGMSQKRGR